MKPRSLTTLLQLLIMFFSTITMAAGDLIVPATPPSPLSRLLTSTADCVTALIFSVPGRRKDRVREVRRVFEAVHRLNSLHWQKEFLMGVLLPLSEKERYAVCVMGAWQGNPQIFEILPTLGLTLDHIHIIANAAASGSTSSFSNLGYYLHALPLDHDDKFEIAMLAVQNDFNTNIVRNLAFNLYGTFSRDEKIAIVTAAAEIHGASASNFKLMRRDKWTSKERLSVAIAAAHRDRQRSPKEYERRISQNIHNYELTEVEAERVRAVFNVSVPLSIAETKSNTADPSIGTMPPIPALPTTHMAPVSQFPKELSPEVQFAIEFQRKNKWRFPAGLLPTLTDNERFHIAMVGVEVEPQSVIQGYRYYRLNPEQAYQLFMRASRVKNMWGLLMVFQKANEIFNGPRLYDLYYASLSTGHELLWELKPEERDELVRGIQFFFSFVLNSSSMDEQLRTALRKEFEATFITTEAGPPAN